MKEMKKNKETKMAVKQVDAVAPVAEIKSTEAVVETKPEVVETVVAETKPEVAEAKPVVKVVTIAPIEIKAVEQPKVIRIQPILVQATRAKVAQRVSTGNNRADRIASKRAELNSR